MATVLDSPQYPGLKIFVGGAPIKGAFYVPTYGQAMTKISKASHGSGTLATAWKINTSPWNQANCVYRKDSANCSSAVRPGPTNYNDGWIALCQKDTQDWAADLGLNYPVLWIPTADWKEPEDLAPKAPVVGLRPTPGLPKIGIDPFPGDPPGEDPVIEEPEPEIQKAGYGWLFALLGLGLLIAGGVAVSKRGKKK